MYIILIIITIIINDNNNNDNNKNDNKTTKKKNNINNSWAHGPFLLHETAATCEPGSWGREPIAGFGA